MNASAVREDPADDAKPSSFRGDLRLAGLVLALCAWDATGNTIAEFGLGSGDWLASLRDNCQFSLLTLVPGVLAARFIAPGYPTDLRGCLQIVAMFFIGTAVGHWLAFRLLPPFSNPDFPLAVGLRLIAQGLVTSTLTAAAVVGAMYWWRRGTLIRQELHRTRTGLLAMKADQADAELLRLRTQIEPHFLFNTIATVVQMYQTDAAAARRALARLIDYMDASHAHMRRQEAVLADELALTEGYLEIQRLRMGARLRYEIDVAADLHRTGIPPAALLTLVENAIKHGLAPQTTGGTVRVSAQRDGESVVLRVADDGVGLRGTRGRGLGLANVRARAQGLYGSAASLRLTSTEEGGTMATMRLPLGEPGARTIA